MKLTNLLAASRSFAHLRNQKCPYAVTKENLLPAFSTQPRLRSRCAPQGELRQVDLLDKPAPARAAAAEMAWPAAPSRPDPIQAAQPTPPAPKRARKPGFWSFFRSLFGLRQRGSRSLVQSELELGKVKVMRNDLREADLELVVLEKSHRSPRPIYKALHQLESNPLIRVRTRLFEAVRR